MFHDTMRMQSAKFRLWKLHGTNDLVSSTTKQVQREKARHGRDCSLKEISETDQPIVILAAYLDPDSNT